MRATKFEFEQRFWVIGLIFFIGFSLYHFDQANFAAALLHLMAPDMILTAGKDSFSCG